ncbi:MAG: hypothetical protein AB7O66_18870 [Limisphaerales bacterium]
MARARDSRKKRTGALAPTVTSALMICLAAALALLVQIRLKADLHRLYGGISALDRQVAQARRMNHKLEVDYEMLTSPAGLNNRLRDLQLNLIMPGENARVVLPEPRIEPPLPVVPIRPDGTPGEPGGIERRMAAMHPDGGGLRTRTRAR